MIHKDVHGPRGGKLGLSHGVHVGAAAEVVGEKEDVSVTPWCERQRPEIIDADEDARAVG